MEINERQELHKMALQHQQALNALQIEKAELEWEMVRWELSHQKEEKKTFLNDLGGNPNKKNGCNETSLHCACQLTHKSFSAEERRAACVTLLLQWRGVPLNSGGWEKVDLQAQDQNGNTALHSAAMCGMERCIELLLTHGAPLFAENHDKLTPCDVAMRNNFHGIAQLLESRMVFVSIQIIKIKISKNLEN
uniref:(California timema) hypothetical protein n=1 Tax=Timema californicum TaxID=61474 RepID=A0A7R9P7G8_TIMCA|nr:unnamed protein product [Timema californicum]